MKPAWVGAALTYVGAVVGAGFASGQEIFQFFTRFGVKGSLGLAVAGALFLFLGYLALERGRREQPEGLAPLLANVYPWWAVRGAEGLSLAFLVIGLAVVAAGGGAAMAGLFQWPPWLGGWVTLALVIVLTARGTRAILQANAVLVPFLLVMVAAVAARAALSPIPPGRMSGDSSWLLSALLYVSYNIFTGIMVLVGVGAHLRSRWESAAAAAGGAFLLTVMAYLEHRALLVAGGSGALPLVSLARALHPVVGMLFAASLWVALYTTGVAEAYALRAQAGRWWLGAMAVAGAMGLIAFDRLVASLYPAMGLLAVVVWIPLLLPKGNRHDPEG
ncbi:MAG: transporter [Firmicutes bacterium]|nr:transporter [Bacillota bacterium]